VVRKTTRRSEKELLSGHKVEMVKMTSKVCRAREVTAYAMHFKVQNANGNDTLTSSAT